MWDRNFQLKDGFIPTSEKATDGDGKERPVVRRRQVLFEQEVVSGNAIVPAAGLLSALFRDIRLRWGGCDLLENTREQAFFQAKMNLLMTTKQKNVMDNYSSALWFLDEESDQTKIEPFEDNQPLTERYMAAGSSRVVTMSGMLLANGLTDVQPNSFIPPKLPIQLRLVDNKPTFYCTVNNESSPFFKFESIYVSAQFHELTAEAKEKHQRALLAKAPCHWFYMERGMRWNLVKSGLQSYRFVLSSALLKDGILPQKLALTFVESQAWFGSYSLLSGIMTGLFR